MFKEFADMLRGTRFKIIEDIDMIPKDIRPNETKKKVRTKMESPKTKKRINIKIESKMKNGKEFKSLHAIRKCVQCKRYGTLCNKALPENLACESGVFHQNSD